MSSATRQGSTIRRLLIDNGFQIYSVRKHKRMVGGQKYNFHGGIRQGFCIGKPRYFYVVDLLTGASQEDYELAALILNDNGYETTLADCMPRLTTEDIEVHTEVTS